MANLHKQLYVTNRDEWRSWLKANHATEKEVWLIHYKKHTGKPTVPYEDAVEEALCFGWIDGLMRSIDGDKYALRYSPRKSNSIWSESNKRRVQKMIDQGRMTEAGLAKIRAALDNGQWDAATLREDVTQVPPELEEALAGDRIAKENFDRLAPSHKRQYIYWINSAKRNETKQKRIEETVSRARENRKPGM